MQGESAEANEGEEAGEAEEETAPAVKYAAATAAVAARSPSENKKVVAAPKSIPKHKAKRPLYLEEESNDEEEEGEDEDEDEEEDEEEEEGEEKEEEEEEEGEEEEQEEEREAAGSDGEQALNVKTSKSILFEVKPSDMTFTPSSGKPLSGFSLHTSTFLHFLTALFIIQASHLHKLVG